MKKLVIFPESVLCQTPKQWSGTAGAGGSPQAREQLHTSMASRAGLPPAKGSTRAREQGRLSQEPRPSGRSRMATAPKSSQEITLHVRVRPAAGNQPRAQGPALQQPQQAGHW